MRLTRGNSRVRPDGGAAAVELALVLPVLLLLVFGIVQYGWYFFQAQETTFAVREGARVAAVGAGNAQQVCELIGRKMATTDGAKVSVATAGPNVGDQITVTVARQATNLHFAAYPVPGITAADESGSTDEGRKRHYKRNCDIQRHRMGLQ